MTDRPDDKTLEDLLMRIQPQPSERFYNVMEHAAWNRHRPKLLYVRSLAATLLLVVVLVMTIPALRTGAQEFFSALFGSHDRVAQIEQPQPTRYQGDYLIAQ